MDEYIVALSPVLASFGVGLALASAPGPVQAVLLTEAIRGGLRRGLAALVGANLTFGTLLVALALGLSVEDVDSHVIRVLQLAGGGLLIWLGFDAFRSPEEPPPRGSNRGASPRVDLPPPARGGTAVLLFPGTWLFLAVVASPLIATARSPGGTGMGLAAALALMAGAGLGDAMIVVIAGIGLRAIGLGRMFRVRRALAITLAALGIWLLMGAALSVLEH